MSLNEIDDELFGDEPVCASTFMLMGVGPEPDAQEIMLPIHELVGAQITNTNPIKSDHIPTEDSVLSLSVHEETLNLHIWVSDVNDAVASALELDLQSSDQETQMAINSDWVLFVVGELRTEAILEDLSNQLRCVELLCSEVVRQVYDMSAHRLWTAQDFRDQIAIPGCPPISDLYTMTMVSSEEFQLKDGWNKTEAIEDEEPDSKGFWAHTHGLDRFGLPDIEAFDVPNTHKRQFLELLDSLVERIIDSPELLLGVFPMGDNTRGTLIDMQEILPHLPENMPGVFSRVRNQDASLYGDRRVLLGGYDEAETGEELSHWDLAPILEDLRVTGKIYRSAHNATRMQKLAKHRLPLLKNVWALHRTKDWRLLVKIPFKDQHIDTREHRWFEIEQLEEVDVKAWPISSDPSSSAPAPCSIALTDLSAFMLLTPDGKWDAAQLPKLARQLAVSS